MAYRGCEGAAFTELPRAKRMIREQTPRLRNQRSGGSKSGQLPINALSGHLGTGRHPSRLQTWQCSAAHGYHQRRGTIGQRDGTRAVAPGYFADLVAVEGDPLADIDVAIHKMKWVMKGGTV